MYIFYSNVRKKDENKKINKGGEILYVKCNVY